MSEHNLVELNKRKRKLAQAVERLDKRKSNWTRGLERIGWEKQGKGEKWWRSKKNILLISISLTIVLGLALGWIFFGQGIFNRVNCVEVERSFSIESACHLNDNEVMINLVRDSDKINLKRLKFEFSPSQSLWKVDGAKCLDVRLKENKYGSHCGLIKEEKSQSYVFNLGLGIQQSVKVWAEGDRLNCELGKIKIGKNC